MLTLFSCNHFAHKLELLLSLIQFNDFTKSEANELIALAKQSIEQKVVITNLKNKLGKAKKDINIWKQRYEQLLE